MHTPTDEEQALLSKCVAKVGCEEAHQCLLMPYAEFLRTAGLGPEEGRRAWELLSRLAYPWEDRCQSALALAEERWITTGDPQIDALLGGGIRLGSIVEIVGESAAGKTQLCLQLAIAAQLPRSVGGAGGDVIYISTEGAFPTQRLAHMAGPFVARVCGRGAAPSITAQRIMRHVQIAELDDMETMFHALDYKVPALLSAGTVRLVIIDSIAAHTRFDMSAGERAADDSRAFYKERSSHLVQMGARFKRWADQYDCAFVCVNQVTDVFPAGRGASASAEPTRIGALSEQSTDLSQMDSQGEFASMARARKAPALGAMWANIINARIMLYQRRGLAAAACPRVDADAAAALPAHLLRTRRWLENAFSPWAPRAQCEVVLGASGFQHAPLEASS
ncbi:DNA repair protein rhp57 [Coemansia sp. RSA 2610]|nr:DNA repair protein rhp57 [Coemansia sp. RSA 2610]